MEITFFVSSSKVSNSFIKIKQNNAGGSEYKIVLLSRGSFRRFTCSICKILVQLLVSRMSWNSCFSSYCIEWALLRKRNKAMVNLKFGHCWFLRYYLDVGCRMPLLLIFNYFYAKKILFRNRKTKKTRSVAWFLEKTFGTGWRFFFSANN